ncbi:MAG TPA: M24 family metallopeptidase, partial [Acetobacteraceae bacterium]|nr:M24 family metallopeptidase [Acetobacteraceae bacterium]
MTSSHLVEFRAELVRRGLQGFLVPRADEHLGEYVPPSAERLAWLTGFTGSAGIAVVLADRAALFVDGRYVLQAAAQTDGALWQRRHVTQEPPAEWLAAAAPAGTRIGYDPWLIAEEALQKYRDAGLTMVPVEPNPLDAVWRDRPGPPLHPAEPHPLAFAGRASADKRADIAAGLRAAREDAAVLTDPAAIAWLLNIRGSDVPFTPFALGFALIAADASVTLFMHPHKLPLPTRAWLGEGVTLADRAALPAALDALSGKRVRVDPTHAPVWFADRLRAAGATVAAGMDPCLLPKASKNPVEQDGARAAHRRDAIALCRFLHWFAAAPGRETEMSAAAQLLAFRAELPDFRGESFPAISAAGEHGAIMHYRVDADTNRPIRADELYLIDSGAQFPDGTTDVTRTLWTGEGVPPAELRDRFTRVLKGHIALATLVFPQGVAGPHLDAFARQSLWQAGLDFDHGTGHGVGSYLSVHEGPASFSRLARPVPLAAGMILSDEPGFYAPGRYGIRLENLLLVQPARLPEATRPFLGFETLTLAPFDRALIEPALLSLEEIA